MSKRNSKVKIKNKTAVVASLKDVKQFKCANFDNNKGSLLYRIVYHHAGSRLAAFLLVLSFVFQGVTVTYASELIESENITPQITDDNVPVSTDAGSESDVTMLDDVSQLSNDETNNDEEKADVEILSATELDEATSNDEVLATEVEEMVSLDDETILPESDAAVASSTELVLESNNEQSSDSTDDTIPLADDNGLATSTTVAPTSEPTDSEAVVTVPDLSSNTSDSEEILPNIDEETVSSTTQEFTEVATTTTEEILDIPITIVKSDTEFTFNRDECTKLASGSFYCLEATQQQLEDALFSAPDADGDLEIFLVRDGTQMQVTSNLTDDGAPFYDANSDSIVWHRLLNDRFQIISYDITTGNEEQLTDSQTNNMEPNRQGKYTVWQRWLDNNWDIVLHDGTSERIITESKAHDIAPYVHGSLIVWNRYSAGNNKTIEMYDMISETYVTVDDPEGLSVSNPRMVFVYDSLHPNGDIVTKGYDMIARKFIELDTLPRQLPENIPESESTGETRALIQSKPTLKSEVEELQANPDTGTTTATSTNSRVAEPLTLDLSLDTTLIATTSKPLVSETFDLVIAPYASSSLSESSVQEPDL